MTKSAHLLTVAGVTPQGRDAILLHLELKPGQRDAFAFQPGQYLTLAPGTEGPASWRCYSITSEPVAGAPISVLVRRVAGGQVSNWLCDHAQPGQPLRVLPPAGRFTLARPGQPVLLYAGGSGVAPIFALARAALARGAASVRLFYANRDRDTAMLLDEWQALEQASARRLETRLWFDAEQGLPSPAVLADSARGFEAADIYLCGPQPFMQAVGAALEQAGVDPHRLHREDYAAAVDSGEDGAENGTGNGAGGPAALLTVQLDGQTHSLPVESGELLLSAMLRAGLPAPHACRVGECASCMCRLQAGAVERLDSSVLDEQDVAAGWLLACRARAASAELRLRFS